MNRALLTFTLCSTMFAQAPTAQPGATPPKPAPVKRVQPPARIIDFKADKTQLNPGQTVTLIWSTEIQLDQHYSCSGARDASRERGNHTGSHDHIHTDGHRAEQSG